MSQCLKPKVVELASGSAASTNIPTMRQGNRGLLLALWLILALVTVNAQASDPITSAQAQRIVSQYSVAITTPGSCCSSEAPSGGPLLGNGNLGVVIVNPINTMTFLLGKNEFWSLSGGQVEPMASMALSIPGMAGASFAMQENIYTGTVTGQFTLNGNEIQTNSWVTSNDTTNNFLFTQFTYSGSGTQAVTVSLAAGNGNTYPTSSGSSGSVFYYNVAGDNTSTVGGYNTHQVRVAVGVVGATGTISGSTLQFTLSPGVTVTLVSSIMSNYDSSSYTTQSISNVSSSTVSSISNELAADEAWWASFWDASYVEFANNPVLQEEYYGSLYLLASSSEPNTAPPGLWGPWVEANPAWAGDYTTDYNFETPPLAYFPTNHVALADSYDTAMETWLPDAEANATSNGYTGAYWQCHFGPLPNGSYETGTGEENIKSNGAFLATIMLNHYYYTQSATYAASIWPTISEAATFYQNYLTFNGTTYDDVEDSQVENDPYPETNGTMSLGFIRNLLQGAINLSTVLGESSSQRSTWQNILNNLTTFNGETSTTGGLPYPTTTRNGLQVFANEQIGDQWATNGDELWGITTANAVGLGSSPTLVTIAQNTVADLVPPDASGNPLWVMWAPAAARVGYSPSSILSNLTTQVNNQAEQNLYVNINGGGIENEALVPATISEMMMQSFQGNIILFPNWPSGTNAHFGDNLAYGNFLVSSAIYNNAVLYARIISQAGQTVSITNPWPGQAAQFYRNGTNEGTLSGSTFSITTSTNDVLLLAPSGTTEDTITAEMEDPLSELSSGGNAGPGSVLPYNVNAIYTNGTSFSTSGADGGGHALSATLLGTSQAFNGTTFTYGPSNAPDAFSSQTVTLIPGSFSTLNILAFAVNGSQAGQTFQVNYTNGTYSTATQSISDWCVPQSYSGETEVVTMAYRNTNTGGELTTPTCYVYGYTIPVNSSLTVESITLPGNNNVVVLGIQDEVTVGEAPYGGTPAGIPGTVLAENYDIGGQGVGYNVTSINGTDNGYRSDGVDLETTSAPGGGNDIGWTTGGQWFRYTVNVATAGTYNVTFEVASPNGVTDGFHIANSSGTNLSGSVNIPNTGGWKTWSTATASVTLPAGQQVLTVYQDNGGWNIDSAAFAAASLPYNVSAIYTNGTTFPNTSGADGEGNAFSATLLGATQAFNGTTFTYGPSNAPDAFKNVTTPVTAGSYSGLNILAYAINGGQASQTFQVNYTNGTSSTATQSISDWGIPQSYSGETKVVTMAYRNTYTGGETTYTSYIYGYTIPVNSSLTVQSITLPANNNVIVLGVQDEQ
jgi:alpha-L-fucosidase 2